MVRRRRKQRKQFACEHQGFGRFCHRCQPTIESSQNPMIADAVYRSKTSPSNQAKQEWKQQFATDSIDLSHLPKPIVIKTRRILDYLDRGVAPRELKGKRFNFDRTLLRISVSYRYRLLCRWQAGQVVPLQVLSHEAYNAIALNKRTATGGKKMKRIEG